MRQQSQQEHGEHNIQHYIYEGSSRYDAQHIFQETGSHAVNAFPPLFRFFAGKHGNHHQHCLEDDDNHYGGNQVRTVSFGVIVKGRSRYADGSGRRNGQQTLRRQEYCSGTPVGIVYGKHHARACFLQSLEVEECVRGGIQGEYGSLAARYMRLEVGRDVEYTGNLAFFHPLAGFEDIGRLGIDRSLRGGIQPSYVLPAECGVGEVYYGNRCFAYQIGSIHIVVE